ncbi:MAG: hypothetical protein AVDCRST_MAG76-128, partial [uncultured Acidimicrobiales bacterium]
GRAGQGEHLEDGRGGGRDDGRSQDRPGRHPHPGGRVLRRGGARRGGRQRGGQTGGQGADQRRHRLCGDPQGRRLRGGRGILGFERRRDDPAVTLL